MRAVWLRRGPSACLSSALSTTLVFAPRNHRWSGHFQSKHPGPGLGPPEALGLLAPEPVRVREAARSLRRDVRRLSAARRSASGAGIPRPLRGDARGPSRSSCRRSRAKRPRGGGDFKQRSARRFSGFISRRRPQGGTSSRDRRPPGRMASATVSASRASPTSCTRTTSTPPSTAAATIEASRAQKRAPGRLATESAPRKALAAGADRTGAAQQDPELPEMAQEKQVVARTVFPKPMPGSTQMRLAWMPAASARSPVRTEALEDLRHHVVVVGVRLHGARRALACASGQRAPARPPRSASARAPCPRKPLTSLTSVAPQPESLPGPPPPCGCRRRAARRSSRAVASMTGSTRSNSSCTGTSAAPGRVDSPPTSRRSAPASASARACGTARSRRDGWPPSEKLSGVTLSTPITKVRSPQRSVGPPAPSAPGPRRRRRDASSASARLELRPLHARQRPAEGLQVSGARAGRRSGPRGRRVRGVAEEESGTPGVLGAGGLEEASLRRAQAR